MEIGQRAEPNWQVNLPEGLDALARCDAMERRRAGCSWSNLIPISHRVCA
jgi:hypothetical protein